MFPPEVLGVGPSTERGDKCVGDLAPYRSARSGRVLRPSGWKNYPHEKWRGVAEVGFETNDPAEQATSPAESTADRCSGAMGSASPQDMAARPGFVEPGKTGFLLTIALEELYALLGVEVQEPDEPIEEGPNCPISAVSVHYADLRPKSCRRRGLCRKGQMTQ